jgi:hypothetical protein
MNDKRTAPRHRRRFKVTVGPHSWFTTDLGPGGFGAEIVRAPVPGTRVAGLIHGKDGTEVAFAGQVAWTLRGNMHINLRSRAGVRFTKVSPTVAELIEEKN